LRYLVLFLVVVGVGGYGSFKGSFLSALTIGIIDIAGKYLFPVVAAYLLYGIVLVLLLWRPHGLVPLRSAG
jgi:branched-chain amino acid transport system permease protein